MESGMIARRDLMIGGACLLAAGSSAALKVRHEEPLLKGAKLAAVVPASFGDWVSRDVGDPYAVNGEKTLSDKLYNELVVREYANEKKQVAIAMLLAYGGRQTDELQLHRPEICYPAFGFDLVRNEPFSLGIGGKVVLPARRLSATSEDHGENIVYWSRMGELLPQDGGEQRKARLKIAMDGIIPDGLLSRFSTVGMSAENDWRVIEEFVIELIANVAPPMRKVLVGTQRANQLSGIVSPTVALRG
jgi:EpsI family protein